VKSALHRLERGLWLVGLLSLGYAGAALLDTWAQQAYHGQRLDQEILKQSQSASGEQPPESDGWPDDLIGRLEIPSLDISAIVLEGADEETLRVAVGHLPGTARPGDPGNVVLAAHRDTFFQSLGNIRQGDWIIITTPRGRHRYRVEETTVVNPNNTEVLRVSMQPTVTLITCYPFHFVGPAPQRFVVRALGSGHNHIALSNGRE
jgi:sortase A